MNEHMALCCGDDRAEWRPLNAAQCGARLLVGVALLLLALALPWSSAGWIPLVVLGGWLGASHVLAAVTAYPGYPELGAAANLLLGRWISAPGQTMLPAGVTSMTRRRIPIYFSCRRRQRRWAADARCAAKN